MESMAEHTPPYFPLLVMPSYYFNCFDSIQSDRSMVSMTFVEFFLENNLKLLQIININVVSLRLDVLWY